jgi:hypothetical protein
MKTPFLIGRLLFGGFFVMSGINHLRHSKEMAPTLRESEGRSRAPTRRSIIGRAADYRRSKHSAGG